MRRIVGRWVAVLAVVAGVGVGASALPAAAATPGSTATTTGTTSPARVQPADWWL